MQTQIVSNQMGWVGIFGLCLVAFSLVVMWAVNDKYAFVVLQLQSMTERQNRTEQRLELLEIREQRRQQNERNSTERN